MEGWGLRPAEVVWLKSLPGGTEGVGTKYYPSVFTVLVLLSYWPQLSVCGQAGVWLGPLEEEVTCL